MLSSRIYKYLDLLILNLTFLVYSTPFFSGYKPLKIAIIFVFLIKFMKINQMVIRIDVRLTVLFFIVLILALIQGIIWDFNSSAFFFFFGTVFFLPYLLFKIYGQLIFDKIETFIYYLTFISLIFFSLESILPSFKNILDYILILLEPYDSDEWGSRSIIIYTHRLLETEYGISRNSGFSHEPGGFACFIVLGLCLNYLKTGKYLNFKNLIYIISLITTFSTSGYLSLVTFAIVILETKNSKFIALAFLIPIVFGFISIYNNIDFLEKKINQQFLEQSNISLNNETSGRILGARKSINVIANHPFIGRGIVTASRPNNPNDPEYADYGWLSFVSKFGFVFGTLFLFVFLKGINCLVILHQKSTMTFIIISTSIFINLFAQTFISQLFFMLFFINGLFSKSIKPIKWREKLALKS